MPSLSDAIAIIESGALIGDALDDAMHAAMSALISSGPGYWDTPEGERLRPLWEDWSDAVEANVIEYEADLERRVQARDWDGATIRPYPLANGMMSDDPWAYGDPFAD